MRSEEEVQTALRTWSAVASMELSADDLRGLGPDEVVGVIEEHRQTVRRARVTTETLLWVLGEA